MNSFNLELKKNRFYFKSKTGSFFIADSTCFSDTFDSNLALKIFFLLKRVESKKNYRIYTLYLHLSLF